MPQNQDFRTTQNAIPVMKTRTLRFSLLVILFFSCITFSVAQNDSLFIEGPQDICAGDCAEYYLVVDGIIFPTEVIWSVSDGTSYTGNPLFYCFSVPGTYVIIAEFFDEQGNAYAVELPVFVFEGQPPFISSNAAEVCPANGPNGNPGGCEQVCAGSTVTYFAEGQNFEYEWIIQGAESYEINFNTATVTWGEPGTGSVTVITFGDCFGENSVCVDILADPEASFTTIPEPENGVLSICQGQTVFFQSTSQNAATYFWDFGLNITSTETNPSFTYLNPGTFEVSLIAYNECLCSDTTTLTVEVTDAESPLVDCVGTICENTTVTYSADAQCGTYNWMISANGTVTEGGGTADDYVTIDWGVGPVGTIELVVEDCSGLSYCLEPALVQIPILSDNAEIEGPDKVCKGSIETYSITPYEGTEFIWSVSTFGTILEGQGTNSIKVEWFGGFIPTNPQMVQVSYENCYLECGGSDELEVYIQPEFYAAGPIEVCENSSAIYNSIDAVSNMGFPANWEVKAFDGSVVWTSTGATATPSIIWSFGIGNYTIEVVPQDLNAYCTELYEIPVTVVEAPPAVSSIEGELNICPGATYAYAAISTIPENAFQWEINDGGNITTTFGANINVTWGNTPPYELSVVQISTSGLPCESEPISITPVPLPPFVISGISDVCQDQTSSYSVTSFDQLEYNWSIVPADAGTIISELNSNTIEVLWHLGGVATVEMNICGEIAAYPVNIFARPEPVVSHPADLCPNETATVQSTMPFDTYEWIDEEGNIVSTAATPDISPGYYQLVVVDDNGCIGDTTFYINGWQPSDISISTPNSTGFCAGDPPVTLYALNTDAGYTFQWYMNGTLIAGATDVTYSTDQFGSYHVEITDINGCNFGSNSITLFDFCDSPGGVCNGTTCTFITDCEPGTNINFDIEGTAACNVRNYINTSFDYVPGTIRYDFDDPASGANNISFDENPTHTYTKAGFFTVIMTGQRIDDDNPALTDLCWQAKVDTVLVAANFDVDNACPGEIVQFFDLSTHLPIASIQSWEWDFGDPGSGTDNTSTDINPTHIFANEGIYDVTLTVTGASGCTATMTKSLEVYPYPEVNFDEPLVNCQGTALNFIAQVSDNVTYVEWDFGDPSSGDANVSELYDTYHSFDNVGTYTVTLFAQSIYGCTNTFSQTITVEPNTLNGEITSSIPSPICEGESTTLSAPINGVTWIWSTGETSETIIVSEADVYGVTVTDVEGCEYAPTPIVIDVNPAPEAAIRAVDYNEFQQPTAYFYENYALCFGEDIFLEVIDNTNYSYDWSNGDTDPATEFSEARGNLLDPGTHDITLDLTDNNTGCTNTTSFEITVHPVPENVQITASNNGVICQDTETTFSVVSPDANLTYLWSTGEIGTEIMSSETGEYFVTAINEFGCEAESNRLTIHPGPDISKIPSGCHTRCRPDTICLPTIPGITSYQWYFNGTPVAAPDGTMPELIATEDGDYWLEMTDNIGCTLTSGTLTLELFDGFGTIGGNVYFDVNDNGIIDAADTLVNDVDIQLLNGMTVEDVVSSNNGGIYQFPDIVATSYTIEIDTNSLPANYTAYEYTADTTLIGCDQEIELNWLLFEDCEIQDTTFSFEICPGQSITFNGETLDTDTTFTNTFVNISGCDSVETVVVSLLQESTNSIQLETCENTTIEYDGTILNIGDIQDFTFVNAVGCDSTVTVSVVAIPNEVNSIELEACENGTITYQGIDLVPGDMQDFTFTSTAGCDSTVTVSVVAIPITNNSLQLEACEGETITYEGIELSVGEQMDFTLISASGCDSIVAVEVIAYPEINFELVSVESCPNTASGEISVQMSSGGVLPFTYALDGQGFQNMPTFTNVAPGNHTITVLDAAGCEVSSDIFVSALPSLEIAALDAILPCSELQTMLEVQVLSGENVSFEWEDGSNAPTLLVTAPGSYNVNVSTNCEVLTETIEVNFENPDIVDFLYIPNAFSPNSDGINDIFMAYPASEVNIESFSLDVFDRWGNHLYNSEDPSTGWRGEFKEKILKTGVYIWHIKATVFSCGQMIEVERQGDVALLK